MSKTRYATKETILNLLPNHLDNLYVVLPAYLKKNREIYDFQVGVTGSIGIDGDWKSSAWYECAEEIGIDVQYSSTISKGQLLIIQNKGIVNEVYGIVYHLNKVEQPPQCNYEKSLDDKEKKVICWILFDSVKDIIKRRRISACDKAGEKVVIMTVRELKKLISDCKY